MTRNLCKWLAPLALLLICSPTASAQYWGPWGGGWGWGGGGWGWGAGWGGVGITAYDQFAYNALSQELMMQRAYQMQAQTAQAWQQAALTEQQVYSQQLNNIRTYQEISAKSRDAANQNKLSMAKAAEYARQQLPDLIDANGKVKWPDYSPSLMSRERASNLIASVAREVAARGEAKLSTVVSAKRALYEYGKGALANLRKDPAAYRSMRDYLNNLEGILNALAYQG